MSDKLLPNKQALQVSPIRVSALRSPVVKYQLEALQKQNVVHYYYFFKTGVATGAGVGGTNVFNLSLAALKRRGLRGCIAAVGLLPLPAEHLLRQLHRRQHH